MAGAVGGEVAGDALTLAARALGIGLALLAPRALLSRGLLRPASGKVRVVVGLVARAGPANALCVLDTLAQSRALFPRRQN